MTITLGSTNGTAAKLVVSRSVVESSIGGCFEILCVGLLSTTVEVTGAADGNFGSGVWTRRLRQVGALTAVEIWTCDYSSPGSPATAGFNLSAPATVVAFGGGFRGMARFSPFNGVLGSTGNSSTPSVGPLNSTRPASSVGYLGFFVQRGTNTDTGPSNGFTATGGTIVMETTGGSANTNLSGRAAYKVVSPPGSESVSWTRSGSNDWTAALVCFDDVGQWAHAWSGVVG